MVSNYDLIVEKLPKEYPWVDVYPVGDIHRESQFFDENAWKKWKNMVNNDPYKLIVIVGDAFENATRASKGDCYRNIMSVSEAKDWFESELEPLKEHILLGTDGNHEVRTRYAANDSPLEDVMKRLKVGDKFREDMAFAKVQVGERTKTRQLAYTIAATHGGARNRAKGFPYAIEGCDIFISGHTHEAESGFPARLVIDPRNETVKQVGFKRIVVPNFMNYDGYVMRNMYYPQDHMTFPVIKLSGHEKEVEVCWK